jgi:hypothetical protein
MPKEEILAMKPGRELNIAVAKLVMKHKVIVDEIFGDMERPVGEDSSSTLVTERMITPEHKDVEVFCDQAEVMVDEIRPVGEDSSGTWDTLLLYSEDMSAAQLVTERMITLGHKDAVSWDQYGDGIYTRAEAICKRALLVVLGMLDEKVV